MTDVYKYRLYCETEDLWVETWAENTPQYCPNNNTHTIVSGSITIIDSKLDEGPTVLDDGRPIVRSDSRPLNHYTYFTMVGDSETDIGNGKVMFWDFSNDDDIVTTSGVVPDGYKMKRIIMKFVDPVYMKEGTNYFFSALKGSYVTFSIVCPQGQYYLNYDGTPAYASDDVVIVRYVNKHYFSGDCPMGDELNTEGCAENAMPSNYELWIEVFVPENDNSSYGYGELELYRLRTCLRPGDTV